MQLTRAAGLERDDSSDVKLDKLQSFLTQSSSSPHEEIPLFAALLSIAGGDRYPLPEMTPQRRKERTFTALLDQLKRLAARQPILLVYDDPTHRPRKALAPLAEGDPVYEASDATSTARIWRITEPEAASQVMWVVACTKLTWAVISQCRWRKMPPWCGSVCSVR